ncbi:MAG: ribokinase [Clostridia bacterium]|nr:ribokinase [Clostridia bacterium]
MAKIIGPGSLNVDITGYAPHLPVAGETTKGTTLRFSAGGKGSNQMVAAHRAGAEALLIGQRGADVLGDILGKFYAAEGISECYITATRENETGSALIEIDGRDGQNRIIVIPGANEKVGRESVLGAEKDFADADAVLTQFETTVEAVLAAKELAQKYGKPFILNPAPHIDVDKKVFDGVDFVTPNESEAEQFTGVKVASTEDCRKAAAAFFEMGVKNVIITLGSRGAYFTDGKREVLVPCLKMKAVETTGAGDAFNGGFATAIAEGRDVETALKFATCTAAISVTRLGAATSMPERHEIEALLQKEFGIIL